jgi:hypothetical protein
MTLHLPFKRPSRRAQRAESLTIELEKQDYVRALTGIKPARVGCLSRSKLIAGIQGGLGFVGLAGDTARAATTDEVKHLRSEARDLKEVVAEQALELRLLKKSMIADGDGEE